MTHACKYAVAAAVAASVAFAAVRSARAQTYGGGQFGEGNTWNVYELVTVPATWDQARVESRQRNYTLNGTNYPGHLVTIHSAGENTFVSSRAPGDAWIGLSDSDQVSSLDGTAIGGTEAGTDPNGGWRWVTGEPFTYQAFGGGEPNDVGGEDAVHKRGDGLWNDHQAGSSLGQQDHMIPYLVEYEVRAASNPIPAAPFLNIGPSGGNGFVGLREVKTASTPQITSTVSAIGVLQANESDPMTYTRFEGTAAQINHNDPDAPGGGGGFGNAGKAPFLSNESGVDDEDFAYIANGTIRVPEAGQYTFHVQGDDGFRLKIDGADWTVRASSPDGGGAVTDRDVLLFNSPTGNSNTFAVTNLSAGDHRLEFIFFERGGGAFVELSSAPGDFSIFGSEFKLVGDVANGGLELVPEPASLGLLGFGALGLLARRQRRPRVPAK